MNNNKDCRAGQLTRSEGDIGDYLGGDPGDHLMDDQGDDHQVLTKWEPEAGTTSSTSSHSLSSSIVQVEPEATILLQYKYNTQV